MTGPREVPPAPNRAAGRPRSTRLGWSLAAWLILSLAAGLTVLAMHRPAEHPAGRTADRSTGGAAGPTGSAPAPAVRAPASRSRPVTVDGSAGWQLRLFFTAASSYYRGPTVRVTGCANVACRPAAVDLGPYPRTFVTAVRAQGSGYLGSGPHRGQYLDWDAERGYWLDTVARGPGAAPLQPFVSVISSTPQLSTHTVVRVASCGAGSRAGWAAVCAQLRATPWSVASVAAPASASAGGPAGASAAGRTVRLYVGVENQAHFAAGPWADTFRSAVLRVG